MENENYAEIGKRVKQTYPVYNDLSDEELGKRVVSKYPNWQDMPEFQSQESGNVLNKLIDIFAGRTKEFGKTLGSAGLGLTAELGMKESELASKAGLDKLATLLAGSAQGASQKAFDIRQQQGTLGSLTGGGVGQTAEEVGKRALGATGELAAYLLPLGKAATPLKSLVTKTPVVGGLLSKSVPQAAISGLEMGLTRGITSPEYGLTDIKGRTEEAIKEGAIGAVAGATTQTALNVLKTFIGIFPKAAKWLSKEASKQLLRQKSSEQRLTDNWESYHGNKFIEYVKSGRVVTGGRQEMYNSLDKIVKDAEEEIPNLLGNKRINGKEFLNKMTYIDENGQWVEGTIDDVISNAEDSLNPTIAKGWTNFKKMFIKKYGHMMNEKEVYVMRKKLNQYLDTKDFVKEIEEYPATVAGKRAVLSASKKWLAEGNERFSQLLEDESAAITIKNLLEAGQKGSLAGHRLGTAFYLISSIPSRFLEQPKVLAKGIKGLPIPGVRPAIEAMGRIPPVKAAIPTFQAMQRYLNE